MFVQLMRHDALVEVAFDIDPTGLPPTRGAADACFRGLELRCCDSSSRGRCGPPRCSAGRGTGRTRGQLVLAMGMTPDEIVQASPDRVAWFPAPRAGDGAWAHVDGEVDAVRLRDPLTGQDIALGPSHVALGVGAGGASDVVVSPWPEDRHRCGLEYGSVVAKLLEGGFVTQDGRAFDAHLEEAYARLELPPPGGRQRLDRALSVVLMRHDAWLSVQFEVDPSWHPPTRSAHEACLARLVFSCGHGDGWSEFLPRCPSRGR